MPDKQPEWRRKPHGCGFWGLLIIAAVVAVYAIYLRF